MGGGKGKKRREKNYKEAHGIGKHRLPPPPLRSSLHLIPSKLRTLMSFTSNTSSSSAAAKLPHNKAAAAAASVSSESKIIHNSSTPNKNKKRKRNEVNDLRFATQLPAPASKRKERKKKLLQERKTKHKKPKIDAHLNFPGPEDIKFGEVVQAPPKLLNLPKRFGSSINVSQERIRLRTIEAYRDQKKWASRPGLHLPMTDLTHHNSVVLPVEKP